VDSNLPGYRITRQIGVGAGSKISIAIEFKSGKIFAVKHVVRNSPDDQRFVAQIENEYKVSHGIDHPHIRHSFHIHRVRRLLAVREVFLVMDYIDGLPLETARPNRLNTFLTIFQKVADGLEAMHQVGWVHADIKPTNIMLAAKGVVKIIDFGQACPLGHRKERVQGTPDFIAPEQVRRLRLDQRTDVFNFGATMYWVLTSEKYPTAIRGQDARGGISLVSADKPIAPIELNDKIPVSLSNLVMECCRDNPAERPADMKQVAGRLVVIQKLWRKHRDEIRGKLRGAAPSEGEERPAPAATDEERHRALHEDEPLGHDDGHAGAEAEPPGGHDAPKRVDDSVRFNSDTVSSSEEGP